MERNARLIVDGLSKKYTLGGSVVSALNGVSFVVPDAEVVAVCGPSGSGKSTLFNLIARFDLPDAGSITVDGVSIGSIAQAGLDKFRNRTIGFVFQRFNLIPVLSAVENVELALTPQSISSTLRRRKAEEALDAVGLSARRHHKPDQLSGGQQQRVAVARALVCEPKLVLADEPTGNLDAKSAESILELIDRLYVSHKTCFLVATHDPRVVQAAHRVITLVDGRISI